MWPRSWNSRSLRRTTVWPRWMSGVVGSTPSFTRSGRPFASCRSSSPSGSASTAFRVRKRAASPGESVMGPMLDCRPRWAPVVAVRTGAVIRRFMPARRRGSLIRGAHVMPEPPTPIIHPTATRSERFQRTNGVPAQPPAAPPPPQAQAEEAAPGARARRPVDPRRDLDGLRDADGGGERPPQPREPRPVQRAAENSVLYADSPGCKELETGPGLPADREAHRQPEPHPGRRGRDLAERQERGDRDRGPPLLQHTRAWTTPASRARSCRTC